MTMTATIDHPTSHRLAEPARPGLAINGLVALTVAALVAIVFIGLGDGAAATDPLRPASTDSAVVDAIEIYIVQPGDTLWAIAGRVAPAGADLRPVVDALEESAGGAQLEIGQRIISDHSRLGTRR